MDQQFVIQGEDGSQNVIPGTCALQNLIKWHDFGLHFWSSCLGAKIVDGQLVLPPQYSNDSGETVILAYDTPNGQQFMTEDGQPIVFQQVNNVQASTQPRANIKILFYNPSSYLIFRKRGKAKETGSTPFSTLT